MPFGFSLFKIRDVDVIDTGRFERRALRDAFNGYPILSAQGNILVKGSKIVINKDDAGNISIVERSTGQELARLTEDACLRLLGRYIALKRDENNRVYFLEHDTFDLLAILELTDEENTNLFIKERNVYKKLLTESHASAWPLPHVNACIFGNHINYSLSTYSIVVSPHTDWILPWGAFQWVEDSPYGLNMKLYVNGAWRTTPGGFHGMAMVWGSADIVAFHNPSDINITVYIAKWASA